MVFLICIMLLLGLVGRLWYLMNVRAEYYSKKAEDLHERERDIKAARGKILDIRGNILADNRTVCTVSVIHSQIKDPEKVIRVLSGALSVKEEEIRKKVEKISSIERIQTNVEKSIGDRRSTEPENGGRNRCQEILCVPVWMLISRNMCSRQPVKSWKKNRRREFPYCL